MHGILEMKGSNALSNLHFQVLFISFCLFIACCSSLKLGETCSSANDHCDAGLKCETCPISGNTRPRCTRIQPLNPTSKVNGLAFNKYSWLTTHNSYAIMNTKSEAGPVLLSPTNQEDSVTSQLKNGARGLMLDMYDFNNDIWLCHSFGGKCYNYTAFQPAINVLKEVESFLAANPSEIVTIFVEDYVTSPQGLTKVFNASGLGKYRLPLSKMPKHGEDWPTVDDMVQQNQRLVVFSSKSDKEASEGIAYTWNYVVENQYGDQGMIADSCPNRAESSPMNAAKRSLILQNYFATNPNITEVCMDNSAPLISMTNTCYEAAGKRWPNFISVDFYQRSDGGGVPEALDIVNGHLTCGCDNLAYCKANASRGTCEKPTIAPPPPADGTGNSQTQSPSTSTPANNAYMDTRPVQLKLFLGTVLTTMLSLWM